MRLGEASRCFLSCAKGVTQTWCTCSRRRCQWPHAARHAEQKCPRKVLAVRNSGKQCPSSPTNARAEPAGSAPGPERQSRPARQGGRGCLVPMGYYRCASRYSKGRGHWAQGPLMVYWHRAWTGFSFAKGRGHWVEGPWEPWGLHHSRWPRPRRTQLSRQREDRRGFCAATLQGHAVHSSFVIWGPPHCPVHDPCAPPAKAAGVELHLRAGLHAPPSRVHGSQMPGCWVPLLCGRTPARRRRSVSVSFLFKEAPLDTERLCTHLLQPHC